MCLLCPRCVSEDVLIIFMFLFSPRSLTPSSELRWCSSFSYVLLLKFFRFVFHSTAVDEGMLMALAHQMYKAGNFKQALENSNAVYERNPQRTDNLLLLGAIHYQVVRKIFNLTLNYLILYNHSFFSALDDVASVLWRVRANSVFYASGPNISALIFFSCMILICALQKMRKLFELILALLSAMEIWQMHGRYTLRILDGCHSSSI